MARFGASNTGKPTLEYNISRPKFSNEGINEANDLNTIQLTVNTATYINPVGYTYNVYLKDNNQQLKKVWSYGPVISNTSTPIDLGYILTTEFNKSEYSNINVFQFIVEAEVEYVRKPENEEKIL